MTALNTARHHTVLVVALIGLMAGPGAAPGMAADSVEGDDSCQQVCPLPAHLLSPGASRPDPVAVPLPAGEEAGAPPAPVPAPAGALGLSVVQLSVVH